LKDEDGVRQAAARALGSLGPDSALFLIQALQDRNPAIRGQAAEGLAGVGRGSPTVLAALIKALKDRDEKVRQQAGLALYRVGPEVIVLLLEARKNKDNPEASALLQRMGTFFAPELIRLCKAKEEEARRGAAEVLVQVGTGTRMFMADVAQLLKEKDAAVRRRHRPGQARPGGPAPRRRPPDRSAEGQRRRGALPRGRGAAADGDNSQVSRPARRTAAKREEVFPMTRQPRDRPRTLLACGLAVLLAAAQAPTEPTFQGRPLSHWLKQLEAPEVGARRDAIAALAALGPDAAAAVPALLKALDDDDTQVRRGAITALGRIGPKARAAVPALTQALEDKNRDYRFLALRALAGIGPESGLGIPELMRAYQLAAPPSSGADLNYPQRVDICKLLGEQGAKAEKAVPLLVEALKDMQPGVRRAAADALEAIGPAAIPTVVKAFPLAADPQSGVAREEVLKLLKRFGPKAAKEAKGVIEALKSPEPAVRRAAVEFFASLGPAAVPVLAEALQRNDQTLREGALMGLASLGPDAIPELVKTLKDKDEKVRVASARALAQMGPKAKTAVAALAEALRDTPAVRLAAREALGSVGKEAVPFLVQALKDKDDVIRLLAVQGLGRLGPEAKTAIPALIEALKDRHRIVSDIAWNTLRQLGDEAVPSLLEALADKENPLAIRLLGTLRAKSAVPKLIKLLEDPDPRRRELAASTLGDIGAAAKEAQLALNKLLADKDRAVSAAAERALRTIGQAP
jgi:HEAT repeat protein